MSDVESVNNILVSIINLRRELTKIELDFSGVYDSETIDDLKATATKIDAIAVDLLENVNRLCNSYRKV